MKILVTGGAGYIGTELVKRLSGDPKVTEIYIYDNLARKTYDLFFSKVKNSNKISFILGDMLDTRKLKGVIDTVDVVYHLAARVSTPFAHEDPHLYEQINHWGTAELSYLIEKSDVKRVIYTSSASVYGFSDDVHDESSLPRPTTHYGISKLNGEKTLSRLDSPDIVILRCGNVYGYGDSLRIDSLVNRFMFESHHYNRISIAGSGNQFRALIHVEKLTHVLANLYDDSLESGVYNLVDRNMSVNEIVEILKVLYPELETIFIEQEIQLRSMLIKRNPIFNELLQSKSKDLQSELSDFNSRFTF